MNGEQSQPMPQNVMFTEKLPLTTRDPMLVDKIANPMQDLENAEHFLRSEMPVLNPEGKRVWARKIGKVISWKDERVKGKFTGRRIPSEVEYIPPLMNEIGISDTITYLSTIMTKSMTLSYFEEDEIKPEIFWCWSDWRVTLLQKRKDWDVDQRKIKLLSGLMWNITNILMRRARSGMTLDSISETSKEQQILYEKPKSFWQKIPVVGGSK